VPCVPINTYSEAIKDPQTAHMGWVEALRLPNGVDTHTVGFPVRFDGKAPAIRLGPPHLGQDQAYADIKVSRLANE
jgi:crotonobetainyl-CoA:carnitine CoA-transferase CaiB-like acyl-CoA transferase